MFQENSKRNLIQNHLKRAEKDDNDHQNNLIHKFKLKKLKNLVFGKKMANTLSVMTNVLRNVVSKQRIRYNKNGFNLDLAYICDNIIAMGYPADNLESIYRNRLEDVYKFLEEKHQNHYKIYNLCLERSYDKNKFHGRVSVYPFEDHNPPTIELIQKFCKDVHDWLNANPLNVAAVHCKAGKGRTGTMICCYLVYSGMYRTAEEALSYYDLKRTKDRKGVTIPSQRRYVQYFAKLHRSNKIYEKCSLQFCEIHFTEANALHNQGIVHCSISVLQDTACGAVKVDTLQNMCIDFRKSFVVDFKSIDLEVAGDIKIELNSKTSRKKIFHFWVNTYFIKTAGACKSEGDGIQYIYTLQKNEIDDAHKDKEHKFYPEDFKVELVFVENKSPQNTNRINATGNRISNSNNHNSSSLETHMGKRNYANTNSFGHTQPLTQTSGEINYLFDQRSSSSSASVSSLLGGGGSGISGITGISTHISGNELNNTATADRFKRNSNGNATNANTEIKSQHPLSLPLENKSRVGGLLTRETDVETLTDYNYASTANNFIIMAKLEEQKQQQQQQYQPSENNVAIVPPSKVNRVSSHITKSVAGNELITTRYGKTPCSINSPNNLNTKNGLSHHHWKDDNNEHDSYEVEGDDNEVGEDWESVDKNLTSSNFKDSKIEVGTKSKNINFSVRQPPTTSISNSTNNNNKTSTTTTTTKSTNQNNTVSICDAANYMLVSSVKSHPYKKRPHNGSSRLEESGNLAINMSTIVTISNKSAPTHIQAAMTTKNFKPRPRRETT